MDIKENEKDFKETEESDNILKLPINLNEEEKYLLKIFPSKEGENLIFKLEKEKILTYYYYAKFNYRDFKKKNKLFYSDTNINNVFIHLNEIIQNFSHSLEIMKLEIKISFYKVNSKYSAKFILRKKIVAQNRLNLQLLQQIHENKTKIKNLKKQIAKLDKTIENKNILIDNINEDMGKLTYIVNDINFTAKNIDNNDLDNSKVKNNENISLKGEDFIEKSYKINQQNMLLKQNLSYQKIDETKRYISNNKKKKNKNMLKNIKNQNEAKANPNSTKEFNFLCFKNINNKNYKKVYETLILFNIFSIIIIMYLLCYLYALKSNLTIEKIKDLDLIKNINIIDNTDIKDDEIKGIRENIVDFRLKNNEEENNKNQGKKKRYIIIRKKKSGEQKSISLLSIEKEKYFYQKHIGRRIHHRTRDVNFELKYNSNEPDKYRNYTNDYEKDYKILILMITKEGKKYGVFSNNSILYSQGEGNDNMDFSAYIYNSNRIDEMKLKEFYDKYGSFLQNIYEFLIGNNINNNMNETKNNNTNDTSVELLGDIIIFEIYQVNILKKHNQIV